RDAGWKSEIIFDARAGASLSAKGKGFQDDDREALGRSVDGGRQTGWPGADDRDVVRLRAQGRRDQPEDLRQIVLRRVLEHRATRHDDDRKLVALRGEARDERRGVRIIIG